MRTGRPEAELIVSVEEQVEQAGQWLMHKPVTSLTYHLLADSPPSCCSFREGSAAQHQVCQRRTLLESLRPWCCIGMPNTALNLPRLGTH